MTRAIALVVLAACGGAPSPKPAAAVVEPKHTPTPEEQARAEQQRHDELATKHRALEEESANALAQTCANPAPTPAPRCTPSCYATEPPDPRVAAAKKLAGATALAIDHYVCEATSGAIVIADDLAPADRLGVRKAVRGHFPSPHRPKTWQEPIETALKTARKTTVVVTGTAMKAATQALTGEPLKCTTATFFVTGAAKAFDACGDVGVPCEAGGDGAARAIDVVHYRLAEAKKLAATKREDCMAAAKEAIAVARGLPRWRQYVKLNINKWVEHPAYRTRFDGLLGEDELFARTAALGTEAEQVYAQCADGAGAPRTTPADEQSFHACW